MDKLKLFRQRFIPAETILLKDDIIVSHTEDVLVTSWKTLNPKISFSHGASCYFLKEGFKLSKFYKSDNSLLYIYCDIIEMVSDPSENALTSVDLLADVIIYPDGTFQVLDLDELADAQEQGLISTDRLLDALRKLNHLLTIIREKRLEDYISVLDNLGL
jgi:protein associated with RNAse G/E